MQGSLRDTIHLLSTLTLRKCLNALKVSLSYYYTRLTRRSVHAGLPVSISLEPTTSCNLRCPECPSGLRSFTRPTGMLEEPLFKKVIDELQGTLIYLIFYFQGEPYLNKKFLDMVRYAASKKIYTATSTNAHYLNDDTARKTVESKLSRLIISIDGTTQETYSSYRVGGKLEKVLEGTRNVVKWKKVLKSKTPHIIFQFLVVKPNQHQIGDAEKLAKEMGVDEIRFKTAQIYEFETGSPLITDIDRYSRYRRNSDGTYSLKNKLSDHCKKMWHSCVITWDGHVVPCCFDKDASHKHGNVAKTDFKSIWRNNAYNRFRKQLTKSRKEIDICKNCTEGTKIWG